MTLVCKILREIVCVCVCVWVDLLEYETQTRFLTLSKVDVSPDGRNMVRNVNMCPKIWAMDLWRPNSADPFRR